jgi:hypothetical protein
MLLLPVIVGRSAAPLLHTHAHSDKAEIASVCAACDMDATVVDHVSNAAELPCAPFVAYVQGEREVHSIIVPPLTARSGRSPPVSPIA